MTRKHFVAIASLIRRADLTAADREQLVTGFAAIFGADNPRFDPQRFRAACQPTPAGRTACAKMIGRLNSA